MSFVDEQTPSPGGSFVGLGKGTASVTVPERAIARRGGGECSYVIFYDRDGAILAAYRTRSQGCDTWAESISPQVAEQHFTVYRYDIERVARTPSEATRAAVFGGAS